MTTTVRTAISLNRSLFKETEALASRLRLTRSGLFSQALKEFVQRRQNQLLLEQLNAAHADASDESERDVQAGMIRLQRRIVESKQ